MMQKYVNGQLVEMTSEEQTEIENMQKAYDPTVEQWHDLRVQRNHLLKATADNAVQAFGRHSAVDDKTPSAHVETGLNAV